MELVPKPKPPSTTKPFIAAQRADVIVETDTHGRADVFIDDIIPVGIWSDQCSCLIHIVLLVIDVMGCPLNLNDSLPRDPLLALNKLAAESQLAESFTVLGWDVDTRKFTVALTDEKYTVWIGEINTLLQAQQTKVKKLVKLIGKLNWAAELLPLVRYFLH